MLAPAPQPSPLEGEDLTTSHWKDARHWIGIYSDLLRFKAGLLDRVDRELAQLHPLARQAAREDLVVIELQMAGYHTRIELWYQRLWDLQGLWVDPDSRIVRHQGREATLTGREFQLLQFLLDHPHRYLSTAQIMGSAWGDSGLFPEEVRNYVRRVRKRLVELEIPVDLLNKPGRGYSLVFRPER